MREERALQLRKAYMLLCPAQGILKRRHRSFINREENIDKQHSMRLEMPLPPQKMHSDLLPFRKTDKCFRQQDLFQHNKLDLLIPTDLAGKQSQKISKSPKRRPKSKQQIMLRPSPYISTSVDIQKLLRLMKKVSGPNDSVKLQIKKHNEIHIHNAENLICKKAHKFADRMKMYSLRFNIGENTKVFVMNSRDHHIKEALLRRNWIEAVSKDSLFYHLKWVYKDEPADYTSMQDGQFYNHFKNNQELTNKNLLMKNIKKSLPMRRPRFPICYDLQVNEDQKSFRQEFLKFEAVRALMKMAQNLKKINLKAYDKVFRNPNYFKNYQKRKFSRRMLGTTSDFHSNEPIQPKKTKINSLLYNFELGQNQAGKEHEYLQSLFTIMCYLAQVVSIPLNVTYSVFNQKFLSQTKISHSLSFLSVQIDDYAALELISPFYFVEIIKMSVRINELFGADYGILNTWIMKPTGVSRGNGITISDDSTKIFQNRFGKIVQKYIESPLSLQCGRKFDIRQWVLVTSFSPLKIYIFNSFYCRLSSQKYSAGQFGNLQKHLTNYSQNKDSYSKSRLSLEQVSSVMSEKELRRQLGEERLARIKGQIDSSVYRTVQCCKHEIVNREGCFEVYGFDLLVDSADKVWLLEVNLSPACENREPFLGEDLNSMAQDLVNLLEGQPIQHWRQLDFICVKQQEKQARRLNRQKQAVRVIEDNFSMKKIK